MKKLSLTMLALLLALTAGLALACSPVTTSEPEPISLLSGWENGEDEGAYTVSTVSGKTKIVYSKAGNEYAYAKRLVADAAALKDMKTFVFTAKADVTKGTYTALLKIEGTASSEEVWFFLSESYITYHWDLKDFDLATVTRFLLFMDAGAQNGAGTVLIKDAYFTVDAADPDLAPVLPVYTPPAAVVNTYTTGDTFTVKNFVDGGDGVYAVTNDGNGANIVYNKKSSKGSWASFKAVVKGANLKDMKTYEVKAQGMAGTQIIIKPYDKAEKTFTFTGGEDIFKVDLRGITPKPDFTNEIPMIFMVEGGKVAVAGQIKIIETKLTKEDMPVSFDGYDKFEVLAGFVDDAVTAKTLYAILNLKTKSVKNLVITAKAAAGNTLTVKLGDADAALTALPVVTLATADAETHIIDVSAVALTTNKQAKLTIAYSGEKPVISALYFTPVPIVTLTGSGGSAVASGMFCNVSDANRYAFDYSVANKVSATYKNSSWDSMVAYVDFGAGGWNIAMKVTGPSGGTAIINVGGQEFKFETTKLTGSEQTIAFTADQLTAIKALKGIQVIRIFADFGDLPTADQNVNRTFTISQFNLTK